MSSIITCWIDLEPRSSMPWFGPKNSLAPHGGEGTQRSPNDVLTDVLGDRQSAIRFFVGQIPTSGCVESYIGKDFFLSILLEMQGVS